MLVVISIIPLTLSFVGLSGTDLNFETIMNYIRIRQSHNWENFSGGVNISEINLISKIFTYLFRPLPMEAHSLFSFMSSLDNIFLLFLFISGTIAKFRGAFTNSNLNLYFILTYSFSILIVLSVTTSNLGISVRQKWMFLPFLIAILNSYLSSIYKIKSKI